MASRTICKTGKVTFANVRVAADRAVMLWSAGIDVPSELEQARRVPLGRVGHYFRVEVLESFRLVWGEGQLSAKLLVKSHSDGGPHILQG